MTDSYDRNHSQDRMAKIKNEYIEEKMRIAADWLSQFFLNLGFVLLVFPFNGIGTAHYISNGKRQDVTKVLKEMLDRLEVGVIIDKAEDNQ